jgi:hypothetical protein
MDKNTPIKRKTSFWVFIVLVFNAVFILALQYVAAIDFTQVPFLLNSLLYEIRGYLDFALLCVFVIEVIALFFISTFFITSNRPSLAVIAALLISVPMVVCFVCAPRISEFYGRTSDERVLALRKNSSDGVFIFGEEVQPYKDIILEGFKNVSGYPIVKRRQTPQRSVYLYEDKYGNTFDIFFSRRKPEIYVYNNSLIFERLETQSNTKNMVIRP